MTIPAPWTAVHDTPNKSIRQNVARKGVVLHHAAMTSLDGLRNMEVGGTKEVSSTAICKDDKIELIIPDDRYRAWSLSSAYWDSAMRSIETCNESTNGWTISDASHWSLARAVAYWAERDGFWPHRDGAPESWTVIGHREVYSIHDASYSTACPGGLNLGLVVQRARQILTGSGLAADTLNPLEEDDMYTDADRTRDQNTYSALWNGGSVMIDGKAQKFNYGILPIVAHNQTLIAQLASKVAGLEEALSQLSTGTGAAIDYTKVEAASKAGAASAIGSLPTVEQIADAVNDDAADRLKN